MKNIIKGLIPFAVTMSVFAQDMQQVQAPVDPNPSARFGTKQGQNFFFYGEAVWFKPLNFGSNGYTQSLTSTVTPAVGTSSISYKPRSNEFQPGFRLTAGYNTPWGGWDLLLSYTRFEYDQTTNFKQFRTGSTGSAGNITGEANNNKVTLNFLGKDGYKINYNLGDLDLGRMFKVSKRLKLRPHFGIRGLWLTQKNYIIDNQVTDIYYSTYSTSIAPGAVSTLVQVTNNPFSAPTKIKSTLIGLEGGIESYWNLSREFSIFANIGLASLVNSQNYTSFNQSSQTAQNYTQPANNPNAAITTNGPPSTIYSENLTKAGKASSIVMNLDFFIGLRWDKNLAHDNYHLGITAGYEQHTYSNLNLVSQSLSQGPIGTTDFNLQGISCGARFDF